MCMLFAYATPRRELAHERVSQELLEDLQKLGHNEVILG